MIRKAKNDVKTRNSQRSQTFSLPSPVAGWNTRDPIANMGPLFAPVLNNWYPNAAEVKSRLGAENHATGFASRVKTLMSYADTTTREFFGINDSGIFDITAGGAIGATVLARTNGYHQYVNFANAAGSHLLAVNGVDLLAYYDGTTWVAVDGVSTPAITGVTTSDLININMFKNRIFFIEKDSMSFWYLGASAISGAAAEFPLGQLFRRGGYLMAMGTWTIDGGNGVDDFAVFATSEGEIAVFQGTDPSAASTFALVGVYFIGAPLGRRCFEKFGGDLLYLSRQGLYPLSKALLSASVDRSSAMSDNITPTFIKYAEDYGDNEGWDIAIFPKAGFILINIPVDVGVTYEQFVMNITTGAWCRFTGWNGHVFHTHGNKLYMGMETKTAEVWVGTDDFDANIVSVAQTAYTYLGQPSQIKHFKLVRPVLVVERFRVLSLKMGIEVDFNDTSASTTVQLGTNAISTFDTDDWDAAVWAAGEEVLRDWYTCPAPDGLAVSFELKYMSKQSSTNWTSTDFVFQQGGVL